MEPWANLVQEVFIGLEADECQAVTSSHSIAECLVKPLKLKREDMVLAYRAALSQSSYLHIALLSNEILIDAARLRATHNFKLPDALHIATALNQACTVMLTNDAQFRKVPGIECFLLSDFVPPSAHSREAPLKILI